MVNLPRRGSAAAGKPFSETGRPGFADCGEGLVPAAAAKKNKVTKNTKAGPASKAVIPPTDVELAAELGKAWPVWTKVIAAVEKKFAPLERVWLPAKSIPFGKYCRLIRKKRTLLYLLPAEGEARVAVVLGERAFELAMASSLPDCIKKMLTESKVYPEGRFIRFSVTSGDVSTVVKLVEMKTTPK